MSSSLSLRRRPALDLRLRPLALGLATICASSAWAQSSDAPRQIAMATPLQPVVITGTRFADEASSQPIGVSVISADEIRRGGYTTINEAVMRRLGVPGRLDLSGGGEYALDLRGFGSTSDNNMAIVVDGVRISEGDLGGTRLAGIPIETVERIEVLRGSGAVLYGEGATAGAIVITTKAGAGLARRNQGELLVAAGDHRQRELRGATTLVAGDVSLDVAAQRRLSDNDRENFASGVGGASVAAQWQADGLRLVARHAVDTLSSGLPGSLTTQQYRDNPHQASSLSDHGRIESRRSTVSGELKRGDWEWALDLGARHKELRSINFGSPFDYDIDARSAGLRARHVGRIGTLRNTLRFGVDSARWERDVLPLDTPDVQRNRAVYARDELALPNGSNLSVGLRREKVEKTKVATLFSSAGQLDDTMNAWELGAVHPFGEQAQVYARLGTSFRLPNADELSASLLRPQTSRDLELGTRWGDGTRRVEARIYRHRLHDEIAFDGLTTFQNVNLERTRRSGFEIEASQALNASVDLRAAGALRRARFESGSQSGFDVPLAPRRNATVGAAWRFLPGHELSGDLVYTGPQYPTADNACRLDAATTLDLRYAWRLSQLELSLAVKNAGDHKYSTQAFACNGDQPTAIYPEPGRAVVAAARVSF